jgi:hypothetical protein
VSSGKSPLGILAGSGDLPLIVAETARKKSLPVVSVCFDRETHDRMKKAVDSIALYRLGQAGKTIKFLKSSGVERVVLIGKIAKKVVFRDLIFDTVGLKIMARAAVKSDSAIMISIIEELESAGLVVEKQTDWIGDLMPGRGVVGKAEPSKRGLEDMKFGMKICSYLAGEDVGQTMIVKEGVVAAVEAVEGTDEAIERGCKLAGKGAVMVKMSRPNQDLRFDIPAIGVETVKQLKHHKAEGVGFEAGRVVIVNMNETIAAADKAGISLVAL